MHFIQQSNASYQAHSERSNSSAEDTSFAPYIQAFLAQTSRRYSCCNVMLPLPFERSAGKSWLNPKFDSHVLEEQYLISIFPQIRLRFRYVIILFFVLFLIYLFVIFVISLSTHGETNNKKKNSEREKIM